MKPSASIIQSLDRGLIILDYVAEAKRPVTVNELASVLEIDRSSVFRLANTLFRRGLLMHADGSRAYVIGSGLWRMANQFPWAEFLTRRSSAILKKLADETRETAHLAVRKGPKTVIVDTVMSSQPLNVSVNVGDEGLLYCTSVGKALIMDHTDEELIRLFGTGPLPAATSNTLETTRDLISDLGVCRKRGYSLDNEEYYEGIRCVGAPVRDDKDRIVAAVGVSAPAHRLKKEKLESMGERVKRAARRIGEKLRVSAGRSPGHTHDVHSY